MLVFHCKVPWHVGSGMAGPSVVVSSTVKEVTERFFRGKFTPRSHQTARPAVNEAETNQSEGSVSNQKVKIDACPALSIMLRRIVLMRAHSVGPNPLPWPPFDARVLCVETICLHLHGWRKRLPWDSSVVNFHPEEAVVGWRGPWIIKCAVDTLVY